jgi:maleate cis-trans isomerase
MHRNSLLGMLTPSANSTLKPVTSAVIAGLPEASAHFGRFKVKGAALTDRALGRFDDREILGAAELEAELGIPICDGIATVVWKLLRLVGADTRRVRRWESLFDTQAGVPDR